MQVIKIQPTKKLSGTISVPGDKSISHRAAIIGSLTSGKVSVSGFLCSEDCLNTLSAMRALGVRVEGFGSPAVEIYGLGLRGLSQASAPLDLGNSGTGLRLLSGVVSGYPFLTELTGDQSLQKRPMGRIIEPLRQMGAKIEGVVAAGRCPLKISGGSLRGIKYQSPVASAQVKSCLLLAGLLAEGQTTIEEPYKSRDHTERMLKFFGAELAEQGLEVSIQGGSVLSPRPLAVPGDISSAAFFLVAGSIVAEANMKITNVGINPTRAALIDVLKKMGAKIELEQVSGDDWEPRADIIVRGGRLRGIDIMEHEVPGLIDELPVIAVAAATAEGKTVISGAGELRVKESDRIKAMAVNLRKLGVNIAEKEDGWQIEGGRPLRGAVVNSFTDHRIAMAMVVAGLVAVGETVVEDTQWIETSFPGFMSRLNKLRAGCK